MRRWMGVGASALSALLIVGCGDGTREVHFDFGDTRADTSASPADTRLPDDSPGDGSNAEASEKGETGTTTDAATRVDDATETGHDTGAIGESDSQSATPDGSADAESDTANDATPGDSRGGETTVAETDVTDTTTSDPDAMNGACGTTGFHAVSASFHDLGDLAIMQAYNAAEPPFAVLGLEIYDGVMTGVGTRALTPTNYQDCRVCVRLQSDCDANGCGQTWLAYEGQVVITRWDDRAFIGFLEGVEMIAVTIDDTTFMSVPVDGVFGWCLDHFDFAAARP